MKRAIKDIKAREILDSRGNPTVEVKIFLADKTAGKAAVPSGASTGIHEALELRDGNKKRYNGKGVLKAVKNVNAKIYKILIGEDAASQKRIDKLMIDLDGTENKHNLGANAILGVSLASARAAANDLSMPLYEYINKRFRLGIKKFKLPIPGFNIINGGVHANNNLDFQEFMLYPAGVRSFKEKLRCGVEIFYSLKKILMSKKLNTGLGDEGGFAPDLKSNKEALDLILKAIKKTSWKMGKDVFIALDPATSEFYQKGKYILKGEKKEKEMTTGQMIDYWIDLIKRYPIVSIEDGLAQDDWDGWVYMTKKMGKKIQLVGDDFLVTNPERIGKAIKLKAANAVLIKLNQIGTLTETIEAIQIAKKAKWGIMISHRSGETTDAFISDLAVGTNAGQIKSGSLNRGERLVKYNRLMEIEGELKR